MSLYATQGQPLHFYFSYSAPHWICHQSHPLRHGHHSRSQCAARLGGWAHALAGLLSSGKTIKELWKNYGKLWRSTTSCAMQINCRQLCELNKLKSKQKFLTIIALSILSYYRYIKLPYLGHRSFDLNPSINQSDLKFLFIRLTKNQVSLLGYYLQ